MRATMRATLVLMLFAVAPLTLAQSDADDSAADSNQASTETDVSSEANAGSAAGGTTATEMTVEELELFIAQQKKALEEVLEQRDQHVEKRRQVQLALTEREAERERLEMELLELCRESQKLNVDAVCD